MYEMDRRSAWATVRSKCATNNTAGVHGIGIKQKHPQGALMQLNHLYCITGERNKSNGLGRYGN